MVQFPEKPEDNLDLSNMKWVIGSWKSQSENEELEEYWYPHMGDAMVGWFRWKRGESIFLYEFMLFQQVEKKVILKIKHFDGKLEGWENKNAWVEYQAWSSNDDAVYLRANDPKHTPWMVYQLLNSKLVVTFYDLSGNQKDQFEFDSVT